MKTYTEMSHPEFRAEQAEAAAVAEANERHTHARQLGDVAMQIEAHRLVTDKSQNSWVKLWPNLGNQKIYSKLLRGDFTEMDHAKHLVAYRAVLAAIRANVGSTGAEPLYEDLPGTEAVTLAALRLMHHEGKDRMILVLGGSGSGKTSALDVLASQGAGGSRLIRLEADEAWKSPRAAIRPILIAAGVPRGDIPASFSDMKELLIERLNNTGRCVIAIDEAHHVSGTVLNVFKTVLNRTSARLILAGMATLFAKLRANASEEAKQLIHNRLFERVDLAGPDKDTTRLFFARRLGADPGWKAGTLGSIADTARHCGHWSFLRRIVDQLKSSGNADATDSDLMAAADAARREIA